MIAGIHYAVGAQVLAAFAAALAAWFAATAARSSKQSVLAARDEREERQLREIHDVITAIMDLDQSHEEYFMDKLSGRTTLGHRLRAALNGCAIELPRTRRFAEMDRGRPEDTEPPPSAYDAAREVESAIRMHASRWDLDRRVTRWWQRS